MYFMCYRLPSFGARATAVRARSEHEFVVVLTIDDVLTAIICQRAGEASIFGPLTIWEGPAPCGTIQRSPTIPSTSMTGDVG